MHLAKLCTQITSAYVLKVFIRSNYRLLPYNALTFYLAMFA